MVPPVELTVARIDKCVQTMKMEVDTWYAEFVQALHLEEDLEGLIKRHMDIAENTNFSLLEKNVITRVISQKVTKLWHILDRLDALGRNPDPTRIPEHEVAHREKLLKVERSKVMLMCTDFREYQSSWPHRIQSTHGEVLPFSSRNPVTVAEEAISQNQRTEASNVDDPGLKASSSTPINTEASSSTVELDVSVTPVSTEASSSTTVNTEELAMASGSITSSDVQSQVESSDSSLSTAQDESSPGTDNDSRSEVFGIHSGSELETGRGKRRYICQIH